MPGGLGLLILIVIVTLAITAYLSNNRARLQGGDQRPQLWNGPDRYHEPEPQQYGGWGQSLGGGWGQQPGEMPLGQHAREAVDADITKFGDELRDLDLDVVGYQLDEEAQANYTQALDAYENAKQALQLASVASDVTAITHILEEGRYAMACVKASATGKPVPERRPPCFFDPAHGPSVANVSWTPEGGAPREVPACALDSARIRSGANPHIRMVPAGQGQVPYWQDQQLAPWAQGYYQNHGGLDPMVQGIATGAVILGGFSLLKGLLDG